MRKILYIILLSVLFYSCEEVVDVDMPTIPPRLVIDAQLTQVEYGDIFGGCRVVLTHTQDFNKAFSFTPISEAKVTLYDTKARVLEEMHYDSSAEMFLAGMRILRGREYRITVEHENEMYEATETIPNVVPVDSMYFMKIKMTEDEDAMMIPVLVFKDPADERNYYGGELYINDKRMKIVNCYDDEYKNGLMIESMYSFDKSDNNDDGLKIGDVVRIEMDNLAYGSYHYLRTVYSISGGAANPISNFSGNVLGCMKAYSRTVIEKTVTEDLIVER